MGRREKGREGEGREREGGGRREGVGGGRDDGGEGRRRREGEDTKYVAVSLEDDNNIMVAHIYKASQPRGRASGSAHMYSAAINRLLSVTHYLHVTVTGHEGQPSRIK